jgi:hypothetical protein
MLNSGKGKQTHSLRVTKLNFLGLTLMKKPKFNNRPGLDKEDFYLTKEGFMVFTEKYHLKRGYCCKSGCRHCPYGYKIKL